MTLSNVSKSFTDLINHIPEPARTLLQMEVSGYLLGRVDLTKFIGTLTPTLFAGLASAVHAREAKG